ncbi:MAG: sce7725 family protein [Desulfobacter sp.]
MYYAYLRGKQYELLTIKENAQLFSENNIVPIIEPVKKNLGGLRRTIDALVDEDADFILIANPEVGELNRDTTSLEETIFHEVLTKYENYSIGYILSGRVSLSDVEQFVGKYANDNIALIHSDFQGGKQLKNKLKDFENVAEHIFVEGHSGKLYQKKFKNSDTKRILLRDGFKKRRNVDYPDDEHFSDLHATYPDEGMDGFGDYLTVGNQYSETGGPAYAVAVHLTYLDEDEDMRIKHFISNRTDTPTDPAGKFLEALEKLISAGDDPLAEIFESSAYAEFKELYRKEHFPGLGYVKKLSMKHHIELIADYLHE